MTVTLTYDATLARVRMSVPAPGIADTLGRTVSSSWGTADSGQSWTTNGGSASDFSVASGTGRHSLGSVNVARLATVANAVADGDLAVKVSTGVLAAGASQYASVVARATAAAASAYLARLDFGTGATMTLTLRKRVAGVETQLATYATGLTHVAASFYFIRLQVIGTALKARVWLATDPEPTTWQATATDSAVTAAGGWGVRSMLNTGNSNTLPVTVQWDALTTRGTATLERSTDSVRWTALRGATGLDGTAGTVLAADEYEFEPGVSTTYRARVYEPDSGTTLATDSGSLTASISSVWIKSIARPFLNRAVTIYEYSDIERPTRAGVFEVKGRTNPVAVTDVGGSKRFDLEVLTSTLAAASDVDLIVASGDPLYVQVPADRPDVPGGYVVLTGSVKQRRLSRKGLTARRVTTLPCTQVAAPAADVVPATATWQSIINGYATWAAVIAAFPDWGDVLDYVADPGDVIVP